MFLCGRDLRTHCPGEPPPWSLRQAQGKFPAPFPVVPLGWPPSGAFSKFLFGSLVIWLVRGDHLTTQKEKAGRPLPDYQSPPVIEVVYGVQFEPLGLQCPTIGLFWQTVRQEYPSFVENPPLAPIIERFDPDKRTETRIELTARPPLPRLWFIDRTENWLIQVQDDRFLYNWKKVKDQETYPRFEAVSEKFFEAWDRFQGFCQSEGMPLPSVNQLELTYINHISVTNVEAYIRDASNIFPDMRWREAHQFLPSPETLAWKTSFLFPDRQGRLHVSMRHAIRRRDQKPVLLLELTARGMPASKERDSVRGWFAMAREWIVRGFADLTDEQVQKERWGRKA